MTEEDSHFGPYKWTPMRRCYSPAMSMEHELQRMYESEINVSISWFWDDGIDLKLGDPMNGFKAEGNVASVAEIVPWLQAAIATHYPTSVYNIAQIASLEGEPE